MLCIFSPMANNLTGLPLEFLSRNAKARAVNNEVSVVFRCHDAGEPLFCEDNLNSDVSPSVFIPCVTCHYFYTLDRSMLRTRSFTQVSWPFRMNYQLSILKKQ